MKETVRLIVTGELLTVPKSLEERFEGLNIRGRMEPIHTTALL